MVNNKYAITKGQMSVKVDVEETLNIYTGDIEQHMECNFYNGTKEAGYAKIYASGKKYKVIADKPSRELVDLFQLVD